MEARQSALSEGEMMTKEEHARISDERCLQCKTCYMACGDGERGLPDCPECGGLGCSTHGPAGQGLREQAP
jgi:heterodisulfide reductase subunit C